MDVYAVIRWFSMNSSAEPSVRFSAYSDVQEGDFVIDFGFISEFLTESARLNKYLTSDRL